MIDIHSHILPGMDDGAASVDEAVKVAQQAVGAGVKVMFATPHVLSFQELRRARNIVTNTAALQQELDERRIPLQLIAGAELFPLDGLLRALADGLPITLGPAGRHLLLEMPMSAIPAGMESLIFELQARGVTPILAHPERTIPVQINPGMLEPLLQRGVLLQVTASSMLERHGEIARDTTHELLRHRWVHFIASDAHSTRHRRASMAEAAKLVRDEYGNEMVERLVTHNARRIIAGEAVPSEPMAYTPKQRKKRWWQIF